MSTRVVRKLNTSINLVDWIMSSVAGLCVGWCMFYVSDDIDPTVLSGLGMYILLVCVAYYRRNWLAYRAYFEEKIPARVIDSEAEARHLRAKLKEKDVTVAVLGRTGAQSRNVASFPAAIRQSFGAIADLNLQDGDAISRRKLAGILSRSQVAIFAERLIDLDLAERVDKSCYLNQDGAEFIAGYAGQAGQPQSNAHDSAHAAVQGRA